MFEAVSSNTCRNYLLDQKRNKMKIESRANSTVWNGTLWNVARKNKRNKFAAAKQAELEINWNKWQKIEFEAKTKIAGLWKSKELLWQGFAFPWRNSSQQKKWMLGAIQFMKICLSNISRAYLTASCLFINVKVRCDILWNVIVLVCGGILLAGASIQFQSLMGMGMHLDGNEHQWHKSVCIVRVC